MGGEPTQLDEKNVYAPRVSPDGSRIAYGLQSNGDMKLVVRSLTGDAEKIFDVPGTYNFRLANGIYWSPDGQSISYPDESDGIWNQQLTGGAPTRLPGIPREPTFSSAWSRDGGRLAYGRVREVRDAVLISNFK